MDAELTTETDDWTRKVADSTDKNRAIESDHARLNDSRSDDVQSGNAPDQSTHAALQLPTLPQLGVTESQYRCPGESHSISRSVHLSRLAAFFPACRECQHRSDTGALPAKTVERIQQVERRIVRKSVFQQDGVRGVFLNEFTPHIASRIARALARNIWDQLPLTGSKPGQKSVRPTRSGPTIVVGYDERPSSPTILAAVIDALRMMSCQVVDVGLVSKPCFCFAVDHLQASGGVFVTGANHEAAWTGLDLYAAGAQPLSLGTSLEDIEMRFNTGVSRPTRRASYQRSFQAVVPYEAGLWKHFHALRPLKIVVAVRPRSVRKTLSQLFKKLPCQLVEIETTGSANSPIRTDVVTERLKTSIRKKAAHLGVLIHDDGCRATFFDQRGRPVEQSTLCHLLARIVQANEPRSAMVIDSTIAQPSISHDETLLGEFTMGSIARTMKENHATFGASVDDRFWFRESYPACDAVLTLARALQALSLSDAKFSNLLR